MMKNREDIYYLDTSALVKRYVAESGSDIVDKIFEDAYKGIQTISFSYWNIAEAAVVFDKYERRLGIKAKVLLRNLLREIKTLYTLHKIVIVGITPSILRMSIELVFKHHIYVADALQIVSATTSKSTVFVTGDKSLAKIAGREGLKTIYIK